jgi:hypothetical protein
MKNKITFTSLAFAAALFAAPTAVSAHGDEAHEGKAAADTVTGEVIDINCYMAHDGKGKDHMQCAKQCIKKGLPVGLLTEKGDVYLAVAEGHKKANDMLADKAAQTVTVVGEVSEKSGNKMITIHEILRK